MLYLLWQRKESINSWSGKFIDKFLARRKERIASAHSNQRNHKAVIGNTIFITGPTTLKKPYIASISPLIPVQFTKGAPRCKNRV